MDMHDIFLNPDSSRTKIKQSARQIKNHIIPPMQYVLDTIDGTVKTLAFISNMGYFHKCNKQKRKQELVDPNHRNMGADLQMVAHYVQEEEAREKEKVKVSPLKAKRSRRSIRVVSPAPSGCPTGMASAMPLGALSDAPSSAPMGTRNGRPSAVPSKVLSTGLSAVGDVVVEAMCCEDQGTVGGTHGHGLDANECAGPSYAPMLMPSTGPM